MGKYTNQVVTSTEDVSMYNVLTWTEGDTIAFLNQETFSNTVIASVRLTTATERTINEVKERYLNNELSVIEANEQITSAINTEGATEAFLQGLIVAHIVNDAIVCKRILYSFAFGSKSIEPIMVEGKKYHRPQQSCELSHKFMVSARYFADTYPNSNGVAMVSNLWEITAQTKNGKEYTTYPLGLVSEGTYTIDNDMLTYNNALFKIEDIQASINALNSQIEERGLSDLIEEYLIKE